MGNPHSGNPASLTKTRLVDSARNYVLEDSGGKSAGALRVSLGVVCNFAEVYGFVEFARSLLDRRAEEI